MIDFAALKTALRPAIRSLTGLTVVAFEDEPRPHPDPAQGAIALVSFFGIATIGMNAGRSYERDTSREYGQGGDTETDPEGGIEPPALETVIARREVTIRVKVDSVYQDANRDARFYLERMRTRIEWSSIRETLRAAGLGHQETLLATEVNETRDQHRAAVAIFDIRCNAVARDTDTDNPIPTIERVDVTGAPR